MVESAGLENPFPSNRNVGSNPTPSGSKSSSMIVGIRRVPERPDESGIKRGTPAPKERMK